MSGVGGRRQNDDSGQGHEGDSPVGGAGHGGLRSSRGSGAGGADLAAFVPVVEPVVRRSLAKRGLSPPAVDDIMQEVWARGLRYGVECETARECYRWALVVAHRIATTDLRREVRVADQAVPEAVEPDPAELVEHRMAVRALRLAFSCLSAEDRAVILQAERGIARGGTKRERDRFALRLMRARQRLGALMESMLLVLGGLWLQTREQRWGSLTAAGVVGASVVAVVASGHVVGIRGEGQYVSATTRASSVTDAVPTEAATPSHPTSDHPTMSTKAGGVASTPSGPTSGSRRSVVDVPWNAPDQTVAVRPSDDVWVAGGTQERQPDENHSLCVRNVPVLGSPCWGLPEPSSLSWQSVDLRFDFAEC